MVKAGIIFLLFFFSFLVPSSTFAASTPRCTEANPGSTPVITSIITQNNSVMITWTESSDPVTHYLLAYGSVKDQLIYGAPNIGSKGTNFYTVDQLTKNQRYYFRVKAINNCEPGDFSDTVSVVVGKKEDETVGKMPNLSLYKKVLGTESAVMQQKTKAAAATAIASPSCTTCTGLPLLLGQVFAMLLFFYASRKISFLRPLFSILIPFGFFIFYQLMQRGCSSEAFFCRYYIQLSLITFIFATIFHKFSFIHKKIESFEKIVVNTN